MNHGKRIAKIILALTVLALSLGNTPFTMHPAIPPTNAATSVSNTVIANIPIVGENPPDRQQVEPTIAIDPHNSSIIVAGAQDYRLRAVREQNFLTANLHT